MPKTREQEEPSPSAPGQNVMVSPSFQRENLPGKRIASCMLPPPFLSLLSTGRYCLLATDGTKLHEGKNKNKRKQKETKGKILTPNKKLFLLSLIFAYSFPFCLFVFFIHLSILLVLPVFQPFAWSFWIIIFHYLYYLTILSMNFKWTFFFFCPEPFSPSKFYFTFTALSASHLIHSVSCNTTAGILVFWGYTKTPQLCARMLNR